MKLSQLSGFMLDDPSIRRAIEAALDRDVERLELERAASPDDLAVKGDLEMAWLAQVRLFEVGR